MNRIVVAVMLFALSSLSNANMLDAYAEGALIAVNECRSKGFNVAVSIVDRHGAQVVFVKDDKSTIHTKDTSFRKAYTVVTLGPIFNKNTSTELAKEIIGKPSESSFVEIPNIALMSGAVSLIKENEIIGAIGVGGAPGGDKDEACARKGADFINKYLIKG